MGFDEKTIQNLASQLGIKTGVNQTEQTIKHYENKSDEELAAEILKLQQKLNAANIPYEKQLAAVESLMPMMNGQQKARLNKIIGLLKK